MSYAYRCEVCAAMPLWRIERSGDAVVTWSCSDYAHLAQILERLQRPEFPVTKLTLIRPCQVP